MDKLSKKKMTEILESILFKKEPLEILGQKNRFVVRYKLNNNDSIIVKLWPRKGIFGDIKFFIRYIFHMTAVQREWKALCELDKIQIAVPKPLGLLKLQNRDYRYAVFTEDIGDHEHALDYIKGLITKGKEQEVQKFEDNIIQMTEQLIRTGYVDTDYSLINMLVSGNGALIKTDLEYLKRKRTNFFKTQIYSEMLRRLIGSYTYAVQPDTERAERFYIKIKNRIAFTEQTLSMTKIKVNKMLKLQFMDSGIDTKLNWEQ